MFRKIMTAAVAGAVMINTTGCSVVGIRTTPEPSYEVVKTEGGFELRRYGSMIVASTEVTGDFKSASNRAFRPLFNYISGDNQSNQSIAMTAPVLGAEDSGDGKKIAMTAPVFGTEIEGSNRWEYQFVLPASFTLETTPQPTNPAIKIKKTEPKLMAVLRYSGLARETLNTKNKAKLMEWVKTNQYEMRSEPIIAGYDPPWTLPFLRRNEVLIEIQSSTFSKEL